MADHENTITIQFTPEQERLINESTCHTCQFHENPLVRFFSTQRCKRILFLILVCVAHAGCIQKAPARTDTVKTDPIISSSPSAIPILSSEILLSAEIIFEQPNPPFTIETLGAMIRKRLKYQCTLTKRAGPNSDLQQLRIETPTPVILQIDNNPESLQDEINEFAASAIQTFGPETAAKITRCRARLLVLGVDPGKAAVKDQAIVVVAAPQLDPGIAPVRDVLQIIADTVHGYVFDYVHGRWQYAAP
jgi:hypothetical protein